MALTQARTFVPTVYGTWEDAYTSIQTDAKANGFAIVIKRSVPHRGTNEKKKYVLVCNRSTTYKHKSVSFRRRRNVSTIKCDCLWQVIVQYYKGTNDWGLQINDGRYNHEPVRASAYAIHRKQEMDDTVLNLIAERTKAGKPIYNLYK